MKMRKWLIAIVTISTMLFVACSDATAPSDEVDTDIDVTAKEVYDRAIQQSEDLDSSSFKILMEQSLDLGEDEPLITKADLTGDLINDPFTMYQSGTISIGDKTIGEMDIDMEMYAEEDEVYVYENMFNNWMKTNMDDINSLGIHMGEGNSPFAQTKDLEEFMDEFSLKQTKDAFFLTLDTDSDAFKEVIIGELQGVEFLIDEELDLLNNITIDQLAYALTIDKETYNILSLEIEFDIHLSEGDESFTIRSIIVAEFSDFNEVDKIEIPQEVLDEAVEADELFEF